jgi:2-polyprenyl-3-methyl-5-hydroxy-6-metoxy-1,4-benzoquinol methylase
MTAISESMEATDGDPRELVASNPLWYHTLEVAPGVVTPGWFDLRPIVDRMPWPDVRGKRCLDIGTYDGFLAFELERRGASEVLATDIADHELWDWPVGARKLGPERLREIAGPTKGRGFEIARELLASSARLEQISVYDLSPERVGEFDVVVCGSLLLHLRDPLRALDAIRSVCREAFLSTNEVDLRLSVLHPRRTLARLDGLSSLTQWWVPSAAGHRRMVEAMGFEVERESRLYSIPFGVSHSPRRGGPRGLLRAAARRVFTGGNGVPHHALLARPIA